MKTKIIGAFLASVILGALRILENKINKIENEFVREGLKSLLSPVRNIVTVLSDDEPKNNEQVKEVFRKFANTGLADYTQDSILDLLAKIKAPAARRPLSYLTVPVVDMLRIYTDDNPNNDAQVDARWKEVISDGNFHEIILSDLLEPALEGIDDEWKVFILETIKQALEQAGKGKMSQKQREALIEQFAASIEKLEAEAA